MSNELTKVFTEAMPRFNAIAEQHKLVVWAAESQFALQAVTKNPYLQKCNLETIKNAVINIASVGLTLNPADGYAYLVPEYNKAANQQECQLRVSFKGLIKIANDSGAIKWVKADVVKANDKFTYRGINELPIHEMNPFADRGETIGVYCIAKTCENDYLVDMIPKAEIDLIRSCAKTDMVWGKWYDEMAKKAVIKRAAKQWPKSKNSNVLHNAIEVINDTEGSEPLYQNYTPEEKAEFDAIVKADNGMALLAYSQNVDQKTWINLYNSGEKGEKVKLKEAVKALEVKGREALDKVLTQCNDCLEADDYGGYREVMDELSISESGMVIDSLDREHNVMIERLRSEQ